MKRLVPDLPFYRLAFLRLLRKYASHALVRNQTLKVRPFELLLANEPCPVNNLYFYSGAPVAFKTWCGPEYKGWSTS